MLGSVGGHYRPEDVRIGNYAGALEALNGGVTTLLDWSHINNTPDHSDAAVQGLKDVGHPGDLRPRRADRRRVVDVQRPRPPGGHPAHPRHLLLVRRPAGDARAGGSSARQLELRGREARLGARARPRHPDQRARRHAPHVGARAARQEHARPRTARPGHDVHPLHGLDGRGARPDRRDRRYRLCRAVRRDADGSRPSADRQAPGARRPSVAERRRRLERPRRDVHADAHRSRARADRRVHRHAGRGVRADADAQGRARVRDDRGCARVRARGQGRARSRPASRRTSFS